MNNVLVFQQHVQIFVIIHVKIELPSYLIYCFNFKNRRMQVMDHQDFWIICFIILIMNGLSLGKLHRHPSLPP